MARPIIYQDTMDCLEFLTEVEQSYLRVNDEALKKMLTTRAKMFHALHNAWKEYADKDNSIRRLDRAEWKKKVYRVLNLTFKMTNEQAKGIIDLYFQRVNLPKGGLK